MPNWCENTVEIWGEEEDMKEFYDFFGGQDKIQENFSFEKISPMPQELDGTRSPQKIVPQYKLDLFEKFKYEIDLNSTEKDYQSQTMVSKSDDKFFSEFESVNEIVKDFFYEYDDTISQETSDRLKSEYGYDNWYDWRNKHWGTKWDIKGDVGIGDIDNETCTLVFNTAWSPPQPIIYKLQEMFPKLQIFGGYLGEGYEYAGVFE